MRTLYAARRRWRRRIKDIAYGTGAAALNGFSRLLTYEQARAVGGWLGRRVYRLAGADAARAREQLAAAFAERHADEIDELARACFANMGISVMEVLQYHRLTGGRLGDRVDTVGLDHVWSVLEEGRGCIIATAHFGNWEMFGAALALSGLPMRPLVRDLRSPALNRWLLRQRRRVGIEPISRDRSLRQAITALKSNQVLVMVPDVDTSVRGVFVDFFGRPAYTAAGPVLLSQRYGAPVCVGFLTRKEDGRHRLEILPRVEWRDTGCEAEDLCENTAAITRIIERQIRGAPEQWIWMHARWKTRPPNGSEASSSPV